MEKVSKSAAQIEPKSKEAREKDLKVAMQAIERQFGKGSIMRLGDAQSLVGTIPVIRTGSLALDIALGVGGYPKGRIIEIYGQESSGKTTLALLAIAEAQRRGGLAVFIDAEHALDVKYAKMLGVNVDDLLLAQPDTGEQALDIAETLIRTNAIDLIVVDSVAALVPRAELEGEMGESHVGLQARLMSQAMRKLSGVVSKSQTCMIFINQVRMKIGVLYGNPETTTGGNALKYYATIRLDVRRGPTIKEADQGGMRVRVKVVKNKLAPPFREAEFDLIFGKGINRIGEVLDLAAGLGLVERSGSWYSFKGERLGQGREQAQALLRERPDMVDELTRGVLERHSIPLPTEEEGAGQDA